MNNKRKAVLDYLAELKDRMDRGFREVQGREIAGIFAKELGHPTVHPRTFGKVMVIPGVGIHLSLHTTIGQAYAYVLDKPQFLKCVDTVKERILSRAVDLQLKPDEIVNNYFVEYCQQNGFFYQLV